VAATRCWKPVAVADGREPQAPLTRRGGRSRGETDRRARAIARTLRKTPRANAWDSRQPHATPWVADPRRIRTTGSQHHPHRVLTPPPN